MQFLNNNLNKCDIFVSSRMASQMAILRTRSAIRRQSSFRSEAVEIDRDTELETELRKNQNPLLMTEEQKKQLTDIPILTCSGMKFIAMI